MRGGVILNKTVYKLGEKSHCKKKMMTNLMKLKHTYPSPVLPKPQAYTQPHAHTKWVPMARIILNPWHGLVVDFEVKAYVGQSTDYCQGNFD
jgi:hypothetical protein